MRELLYWKTFKNRLPCVCVCVCARISSLANAKVETQQLEDSSKHFVQFSSLARKQDHLVRRRTAWWVFGSQNVSLPATYIPHISNKSGNHKTVIVSYSNKPLPLWRLVCAPFHRGDANVPVEFLSFPHARQLLPVDWHACNVCHWCRVESQH